MHTRHACFMSGEEARQLVGRHQKIDRCNDNQSEAEKSNNELHGIVSFRFECEANVAKHSKPGRSKKAPTPPSPRSPCPSPPPVAPPGARPGARRNRETLSATGSS